MTYPTCIMDILCFRGFLRVVALEFPHIRRLSLPPCKITTHTCGESSLLVFLSYFSSWSSYAHFWSDIVDDFLILVDVS
jgi:hypothetical protein